MVQASGCDAAANGARTGPVTRLRDPASAARNGSHIGRSVATGGTRPPAPSMVIEGRVPINGVLSRLRLNHGAITHYALNLIIQRYTSRFGDLAEIHGRLADDNKSLYQIAYARLRSENVDEVAAKEQALMKTPFGKYRAKLKYDIFEIDFHQSFEWAIIPKLDPERKKRFFVPTIIDVVARRRPT